MKKKEYKALVKKLKLIRVLLRELRVERNEELNPQKKANVKVDFHMGDHDVAGGIVMIPAHFTLTAIEKKNDEDTVFEMVFELQSFYRLPSDEPPDEFFEEFAENEALYQIWPYAGELIASMTSRIGAPTLHLPPLKDE